MKTINSIKNILIPFVPQIILNQRNIKIGKKQLEEWEKRNYLGPVPHLVKQNTICEYQKMHAINILVETGTYLGDMVEAQKAIFNKIISIELAIDLFERAKKRFKNDQNVIIVQGDSGNLLHKIISDIDEPAIFWLDGHYSAGITAKGDKDCPIFEEIDAILNSKDFNHIILIDDARCFIGEGDYPSIEKLTEFITKKNNKYQVQVKHDIIRFVI